MDHPKLLLERLENSLAEWEVFGRRAQLEAIMPVIDLLTAHKVGCTVLAKLLAERKFEIKADTLRQSLHRWRLKQNRQSDQSTLADAGSRVPDEQGVYSRSEPGVLPGANLPAKPLTKAGLAEIRNGHVDLGEIVRSARKKSS
ncbi:hypothetical protein CSC67_07780 [Pusillimonas caeni]|uniref:hypothetical protein n=1 Tax=Pusillimonas caeni TaxID=1348472 RepID=UPI000E599306|nr:hypothetical protein [Pusillimonas caeni]TFL14060.1 hypothetical protein CSC67_07780 [Pusillimonas caeni]